MSARSRPPRIALLGMVLESNAFAPVATEADFRSRYYLEADAILAAARAEPSVCPSEMSAFVRTMDATGPWTPVPAVLTGCQPAGPADHAFFERTLGAIVERLRELAPLDGAYVTLHGAMTTTGTHDPDGEVLARVREAVGEGAPVVATLDLHANVSERMVECASVLIGYLTNPHVDMIERGEEAAHAVRAILAGMRPRAASVRLPLVAPTVTLLTAEGPYGEAIDLAQRRRREAAGAIVNVSLLGGFAFGDTPKNGFTVVVTARDDAAHARRLAIEIAERAWADRARFRKSLTSLEEAARVAVETGADPARSAIILADVADNPGGGGGGDTIDLLAALLDAGARGVLFGSFFDPDLAADAHRAGEGGRFEAVFNRAPRTAPARRFVVPARVRALGGGVVVGRRGIHAGRSLDLGATCALDLGDDAAVTAVVIGARHQTADPVFFESLGLDPGAARVVCVKSRGHFRAGFDEWFGAEQVLEVDAPGLTSPVLSRFDWKGLPRPVYPLDEEATWEPGPG